MYKYFYNKVTLKDSYNRQSKKNKMIFEKYFLVKVIRRLAMFSCENEKIFFIFKTKNEI